MAVLSWALVSSGARGPGCEPASDGLLDEPVAALTSLSFVVAALVVLLGARRRAARTGAGGGDRRTGTASATVLGYAGLVAAVGIGSWIQHGPDPAWSDVAHDLPLLATLAYLGADAAADVTGRTRAWWWWALPIVVLLPLVVLQPRWGDLAQVGVAGVAVALTVLRAVVRPGVRRRLCVALVLLVVGGTLGTLSRAGWPLCDPTSPWQGHGAWHLLAAAALAVLAPTVGHGRHSRAPGALAIRFSGVGRRRTR